MGSFNVNLTFAVIVGGRKVRDESGAKIPSIKAIAGICGAEKHCREIRRRAIAFSGAASRPAE